MDDQAEIQLLRSLKVKLIEILSADADFVLQHADSRCLMSVPGYQKVKSCRVPSEKMTDLLDHIIQRGPEAARGLLELLKDQALQETFPMLPIPLKALKRASPMYLPPSHCTGPSLVKEKQLMVVARAIGRSWREIGRLALDIPSVKLEQIEEDHMLHVERVFAMLGLWRTSQREKATAAHLHSLLSQKDCALPPESIDSLLED
uniref:Zgc:174906 n=1 Tax=Cyclopterus lumpus TaxID=8103 RepID=A0A8C2Z963_CYCLU